MRTSNVRKFISGRTEGWPQTHDPRTALHPNRLQAQRGRRDSRPRPKAEVRYTAAWYHERKSETANDAGRTRHSITSSARASSDGGIVRPSAFAVSRLITRSSLL